MNRETFIKLFRQALNGVSPEYYGSREWKDNVLLGLDIEEELHDELDKFLWRYGERVFCYELYHQTRTLMDDYFRKNPSPEGAPNICLQAELEKRQVEPVVKLFRGIQPLKKEYIPDFLLHSPYPADFGYQELIIEVKANPGLTFSDIQEDLAKIQEFITKYQYQQGIFLTVNTSPEHIGGLLARPQNRDWINTNLRDRAKILFMCKEQHGKDTCEWNLSDLPMNSRLKRRTGRRVAHHQMR